MLFPANVIAIGLLGLIVFQDFRERAISWFLLPALFITFGFNGIIVLGSQAFFFNTFLNLGFIVVQLVLLSLYISLKNKKFVNIIDTHLGLGDILFFVAISASFSPFQYILFYVSATILTLIGFVIYKSIWRKEASEIPLAGGMSVIMAIVLIINYFAPNFSFYYADPLIAGF